jgi:hypothetical protein
MSMIKTVLVSGLLLGLSLSSVAEAQIASGLPSATENTKKSKPTKLPKASLEVPTLPDGPQPYNSVRDTPAEPIPYKALSASPDIAVGASFSKGMKALSFDSLSPLIAIAAADINARVLASGQTLPQMATQSEPATPTPAPMSAPMPVSDYEDRVILAKRVLEVDGSEAVIRHFVNEVHMKAIIGEVTKYVDIKNLSEPERYRLATIAAMTATELGDKILTLTASQHAKNLTREELLMLARDYDIAAQRKLTQMRIDDTGEIDRNAALLRQIAALKIVQAFESR